MVRGIHILVRLYEIPQSVPEVNRVPIICMGKPTKLGYTILSIEKQDDAVAVLPLGYSHRMADVRFCRASLA